MCIVQAPYKSMSPGLTLSPSGVLVRKVLIQYASSQYNSTTVFALSVALSIA